MWTREELKSKAQIAFKANYWLCVLAAVILALCAGSSSTSGNADDDDMDFTYVDYIDQPDSMVEEIKLGFNNAYADLIPFEFVSAQIGLSILIIVLILNIVISIFVFNVIEVGGCRFFTQNAIQPAKLSELIYGFKNDYSKVVGTMFLRNLYIFLWGLLFIIPGIVKSYEYRMVPYLLADDPNLSGDEAFRISREMMNGNKWSAFVLDLSFLGWTLLSSITFGIVGVFYVEPYIRATDAELYLKLKEIRYYRQVQSFIWE
ncbi:MAG: DUF975 family protein [Lachnospiraceae bacterium]|nr:DUF975 family protein [Lachnospiraceae bacterium]